jgi:hypothetical protein
MRRLLPAVWRVRPRALRREYAPLGWITPRALTACPPDPYYDQVAQTRMAR